MDCRSVVICSLILTLTLLVASGDGRKKKVVIHVPYKVKKIKHTHTVYKTIHHHHTHHEPPHHDLIHHLPSATEEHEHFHHMHVHQEPPGQHSQHVSNLAIPDFLPVDVGMDLPMDLPDLPMDIAAMPNRHMIPLYRRV